MNGVTHSSILGVGRRGRGASRSRLTILSTAVGLQLCISMNIEHGLASPLLTGAG